MRTSTVSGCGTLAKGEQYADQMRELAAMDCSGDDPIKATTDDVRHACDLFNIATRTASTAGCSLAPARPATQPLHPTGQSGSSRHP